MGFSNHSDQAIAAILGKRLAQARLEQNITQQKLAEEIGLSRLSYRKLENGEGKLVNFIAALRVLGKVDALALVLPDEPFSPLQQLKLQGNKRKRASSQSLKSTLDDNPSDLDW